MSSLRPLATITLLAVVGVVLYMKINETEPVIPEGVGDWTSGPVEIGVDVGGATSEPGGGNVAAAPGIEAPPFNPSAAATPAGGAAPAWKPEPLLSSKIDAAEAPKQDHPGHNHASVDSSPVARSADDTKLPDMPPLPESEAAAKSSDGTPAVVAAVPFVATPSSTPSAATQPTATPTNDATVGQTTTSTTDSAPRYAPAPVSNNPYATAPEASAAEPPPAESQVAAAPPAESAPAETAPVAGGEAPGVITPTETPKATMYSSARVAVQGDLDRGELAQALLKLSEWYGDPSLTPEESQEVETLLSQLAGDVIYEGPPAHRLEPKHVVQTGETLDSIAQKYNIPTQLLANVNRISDPSAVQPGQELKVMRGPFSAIVDLGKRRMTLMLDRRYAGKFTIELDPTASIEEGTWTVAQKQLTPVAGGVYGQPAGATEDRGLLLSNSANPTGQPAILRGPGSADPVSTPPAARVIRLKSNDVRDVYDILSVGSRITVRR